MKDKILNIAKIVLTCGLLVVVALTVDLSQVWGVLRGAHWPALLVALLVYQGGILARSYRWQALLKAHHVDISLGRLLNLYYVGAFFNNFLPSGFGGDVIKMYELSRQGADSELAVSTVLVDRVMGLLMLFAMALVVLPLSWQLVPSSVALGLLALICGVALGLALFMNRRLIEALSERVGLVRRLFEHRKTAALYASFHSYTRESLVRAGLASLVFNGLLIVSQIYLGYAVGVRLNVGYYFVFVPILSALLALPISVGGFGVREGGYVVLFGQAGVAADQAVAMSLLFYALNLVTGLVGGVLYLAQGASGFARASTGREPRSG